MDSKTKAQLEGNTLEKNVSKEEVSDASKKAWKLKSLDGKSLRIRPYFQKTEKGDVECQTVNFKVDDETEFTMDYRLFLNFCIIVGNEEHRRKLMAIQTRQIRKIPYRVDFKLSKEEREAGFCKRDFEVTVDELIAAYCQQEAIKWNIKRLNK